MRIWHYDANGRLVGEGEARPDPMELTLARRSNPKAQPVHFLIPANATTVEPPKATDGHEVIFANGIWTQREITP